MISETWYKAIAAAPERPANGNQCERIELKAARRKCSKAIAPILDNIRKYAVHASLKALDASRELRALVLGIASLGLARPGSTKSNLTNALRR
jgi:hypothetical protein